MATKKKSAAKKKKSAVKKSAPGSAARTPMIVIASGDRPLQEVTTDLEAAGFEVDQVLHAIGQVTGSASVAAKAKLGKIKGVADVSEAHPDIQIAPPDSPVQ